MGSRSRPRKAERRRCAFKVFSSSLPRLRSRPIFLVQDRHAATRRSLQPTHRYQPEAQMGELVIVGRIRLRDSSTATITSYIYTALDGYPLRTVHIHRMLLEAMRASANARGSSERTERSEVYEKDVWPNSVPLARRRTIDFRSRWSSSVFRRGLVRRRRASIGTIRYPGPSMRAYGGGRGPGPSKSQESHPGSLRARLIRFPVPPARLLLRPEPSSTSLGVVVLAKTNRL